MCLVVINGVVCEEVTGKMPGSFYHCGAWYRKYRGVNEDAGKFKV